MLKIYGDLRSGNCYKIKLLCLLLDIDHEWIPVDIMQGETQTDAFRALNPNGKIPALQLDDGRILWESNAILNYLANGTKYLPVDTFLRSQVLQWQFFEQYSHEPYIAVARYIKLYLGLPDARRAEFEAKKEGGYKALAVMEKHLTRQDYFVADTYTIADICLYAYTHVAGDGDFDLSHYPKVSAWIERMESQLKHRTLQQCLDGL